MCGYLANHEAQPTTSSGYQSYTAFDPKKGGYVEGRHSIDRDG